MRTDKRYTRVVAMITHESIPRDGNGALRLCHSCQRGVHFAGGFLRLLAKRLDRLARYRTPPRLNLSLAPTEPIEDEEAAYRAFCIIRWPETNGEPVCPYCTSREHYRLERQQRFTCASADCRKQYSVTTGTAFSYRKLSFVKLLESIRALAADGSTRSKSTEIGVSIRTLYSASGRVAAEATT